MDADLKSNGSLLCCPYVAVVWAYASTRHTKQCWIFARLHRHTENTIGATALAYVLEANFVDVHLLSATFRKQTTLCFKWSLACLSKRILPEFVEVIRIDGGGLNLLGREGCCAKTIVCLVADVSRDFQTIKSRLLHRAVPCHRAVLERYALLLYRGIHLRTSLIVRLHVVKERARTEHRNLEFGCLARLVVPVLVVWCDGHYDVVATYLCFHR